MYIYSIYVYVHNGDYGDYGHFDIQYTYITSCFILVRGLNFAVESMAVTSWLVAKRRTPSFKPMVTLW